MTLSTKLLDTLKSTTVEPVILLFFWCVPYIDHGNGVLLFNRFCLYDYGDNITFCEMISKQKDRYETENENIQSQTSRWIMYTKVSISIPMLYSTIILGAISDRRQRKLPMIIPAAGALFGCLWLMIMSLMYSIDTSFILLSSFLFGITGFYGSSLMATSAYIGVLTTASTRTWRITVFEVALSIGALFGTATSGLVIDHIGLPWVFAIGAGLNLVSIMYVTCHISELNQPNNERPLYHELCDFTHVKHYFRTLYKPRSQSRRLYIHLIFAAFMIVTCSTQGLYDVLFLVLTKTRGFSNTLFSILGGSQATTSALGNLVFMHLLGRILKLSEPVLLTIAAVGSCLSYSMLSSENRTVIWCSLIFQTVHSLNGSTCRGFLSKLVPTEEQGQVFAFVAMGQCLTALLASVFFNSLYPVTLQIWDGLCVLLAGLLNLISVIFAAVVVIHRRAKGHTNEVLGLISTTDADTSTQLTGVTDDAADQILAMVPLLSDSESQVEPE